MVTIPNNFELFLKDKDNYFFFLISTYALNDLHF